MSALHGRDMSKPLNYLGEVSLVIHDCRVLLVAWHDHLILRGYPVILDQNACLKWSVPGLRVQQGLATQLFPGAEIVVPACGVAHRRFKDYRPKLSA